MLFCPVDNFHFCQFYGKIKSKFFKKGNASWKHLIYLRSGTG